MYDILIIGAGICGTFIARDLSRYELKVALLDREEAMQLVVNAGGVIKSSVSRKTQILVVGSPDPKFAGEDGMSTKERKARELNAQGCSIQILTEKEFLELLRPM